ncbi:B12-binding domain-containing radical SAM protein [candidate division KSB1 bacterium]|nr:B12-binding domain-containing radical SAM protein [candidate division KSB1 bacterium]
MNILLVSPKTPTTFWSFHNALKFISKKSSEPPLGLLTVAAMLPKEWNKKVVDLNVEMLKDKVIRWADYVFLTGMNVHTTSIHQIIKRCKAYDKKIVGGGPLFTTDHQEFPEIDYFVLNEAEKTLPMFVNDLENGTLQRIYTTTEFPDIAETPIPMWELVNFRKYASISIQYSRGCPFNCDFCNVTILNGHKPRTKSAGQFLAELDSLYLNGWRGAIFIVDDNFIGNKAKLKRDVLPAMIEWSRKHNYPFRFMTEVSINLADDDELVQLMADAGFDAAFIGIETPNDESLAECGKSQNQSRDLIGAVKKLQRKGIAVSAGFIVGFDSDPPSIFKQQMQFIQNSGIVTAMVGLLNAPTGTKLFHRMKQENRLLERMSGDNTDGSMNFIPKMNYDNLKKGYKDLVTTIYSPKAYYERVKTFLMEYKMPTFPKKIFWRDIKALFRSIWVLGLIEKGKRYYWRLFFYSLFRCPEKFPLAITMAIYGFHFRRVAATI